MSQCSSRQTVRRLCLYSFLVTCSVAAWAEPYVVPMSDRNRELSVFSRADPALDPSGLIIGRYTVFPVLTLEGEHTDNLYSSQTTKQDDLVYTIKPSLKLTSNFDRHQLDLSADVTQTLHKNFSTEDTTEYGIDLTGRYDVTHTINLPISLSYRQEASQRGSPDDQDGLEPTTYETITARTGAVYDGEMFEVALIGTMTDITYDDTPTATGIKNNQDRNRTETRGYLRLGLSPERDFVPYIYAGARDIAYDDLIDDGGYNRSAGEIEGGIGAQFYLTSLARSRLQVGYARYNLDDSRFSSIGDVTYLANIIWEPSTLMAFSLTGQRQVVETTLTDLAASVDSTINFSTTYELTPSVFVTPSVEFLEKDYKGLTSGLLEKTTWGVGIDYKMSKNFWWSAKYEYITQKDKEDSPSIGEYNRNNVLLSLRVQF